MTNAGASEWEEQLIALLEVLDRQRPEGEMIDGDELARCLHDAGFRRTGYSGKARSWKHLEHPHVLTYRENSDGTVCGWHREIRRIEHIIENVRRTLTTEDVDEEPDR